MPSLTEWAPKTSVSGYVSKHPHPLITSLGGIKHPLREPHQQRRPQVPLPIRSFHELQCCSLSDPFAVLYQKTEDVFEEIGRTEIIPNNLSMFVRLM